LDQSSVLSFRSNYQNFLNLNAIIVRDFVSFYCLFNVRFGCASLLRWKQWWDQVAPLKCWKLLWIPCQHFSTPLPLCLPWQDPMHPFEPIFNGLAASYTEQKSVSVPWNLCQELRKVWIVLYLPVFFYHGTLPVIWSQ
jgi:hypothetical protein